MAKTRAQRKAERRKREAQTREGGGSQTDQAHAQRRTQVPESADVIEAELAEQGADLDALTGRPDAVEEEEVAAAPPTPGAPSQSPIGFGELVDEPVEELEAPAPSRADVGAPAEDKISRRARRGCIRATCCGGGPSSTAAACSCSPPPRRPRAGGTRGRAGSSGRTPRPRPGPRSSPPTPAGSSEIIHSPCP